MTCKRIIYVTKSAIIFKRFQMRLHRRILKISWTKKIKKCRSSIKSQLKKDNKLKIIKYFGTLRRGNKYELFD